MFWPLTDAFIFSREVVVQEFMEEASEEFVAWRERKAVIDNKLKVRYYVMYFLHFI